MSDDTIKSDIIILPFPMPEQPRFLELFYERENRPLGIWVDVEELPEDVKAQVLDTWRELRRVGEGGGE